MRLTMMRISLASGFLLGLALIFMPKGYAGDTPLMSYLSKAGVGGPFKKLGINVYGYADAGYMYDLRQPRKGLTFMSFNNLKNTPILDKIDLTLERTVDPTKKQLDWGFRSDIIWGYDAQFIHSNGMDSAQTGRYQWDPTQLYVDIAFPGLPMKIRIGKWIELAGFEQFSSNIYGAFGDPSKALYSYSYSFFYAEPGTQSGAFFTYVLNPQWTFDAGITRGWNQSTRDSNSRQDFLGRVTYTPTDKTSVIFVMTEGPEFPIAVGRGLPPGDKKHWWTALDLVVTQKVTDRLSLGVGIDYVEAPRIPGLKDGSKEWGAIDGYLSYVLSPHYTLNARLEWYNDSSNGYATTLPITQATNFYESTVGVAIKPFLEGNLSGLLFRPEVRYDGASHPVFGKGNKGQVLLCADLLFQF